MQSVSSAAFDILVPHLTLLQALGLYAACFTGVLLIAAAVCFVMHATSVELCVFMFVCKPINSVFLFLCVPQQQQTFTKKSLTRSLNSKTSQATLRSVRKLC